MIEIRYLVQVDFYKGVDLDDRHKLIVTATSDTEALMSAGLEIYRAVQNGSELVM